MTALKIPDAPPPPPALIRYRHWNARAVAWDITVPEVENLVSSEDSEDEAEEDRA